MHILHFSEPVTRRKRIHWITNQDGQVLCASTDAKEIWLWLYENEVKEVLIDLPKGSLEITIGQFLPW